MTDWPRSKLNEPTSANQDNRSTFEAGGSLFVHPDAETALTRALELLPVESDRGAVIIAMDMVDTTLEEVFTAMFPKSLAATARRRLLGYPGVLSSVAAKAEIAVAVRMIDHALFDAITALRKLRNKVAHSTTAFRLAAHEDKLRTVMDLGPSVPAGVNRLACEFLVFNAALHIRGTKVIVGDKELVPIATDQSAIQWLANNRKILDVLEERRHRCELAIGVGIICACLILRRDKIAAGFCGTALVEEKP